MRKILKKHWPLIGIAALIVIVAFYLIQALQGLNNRPDISDIFAGEGVKLKQIHVNQEYRNPSLGCLRIAVGRLQHRAGCGQLQERRQANNR